MINIKRLIAVAKKEYKEIARDRVRLSTFFLVPIIHLDSHNFQKLP